MDDSRVSISIYSTGSSGGETGPIGFLPDGKKLHLAYTDEYLRRRGGADGSTIAMTEMATRH